LIGFSAIAVIATASCVLLSASEFFKMNYCKVLNGLFLDFLISVKLNLEEGVEDDDVDELGQAA